jgi:uncharacterized protein
LTTDASLVTTNSLPLPSLQPISAMQRIDALDILRGFALMGILLMNIEWFNRPIAELSSFDSTASGLDYAFGWLVRCFVEGKFYKLFALLFGMGFAVMLNRALQAERPFKAWFIRRMLVLWCIGLAHLIFLWEGDILHDYAFAGLCMLGFVLLLESKWKKYNHPAAWLKIALWWLALPFIVTVMAGIGYGLSVDPNDAEQAWLEQQTVQTLVSELEQEATPLDALESVASVTVSELTQTTSPLDTLGNDTENHLAEASSGQDNIVNTTTQSLDDKPSIAEDNKSATPLTEPELSAEDNNTVALREQAKEILAEQAKQADEVDAEISALRDGTYWQATQFRAGQSVTHLLISPGFTLTMLLPIFLLGYWLINIGAMRNPAGHRHLFKRCMFVGLGVGLPVTVASLIIMAAPAVEDIMAIQVASNVLFAVAEFFMTAGYLGLIMTLLQTRSWQKRLAILAPMGQMALTNYLMHSLILTSIFYGYAGGFYGEIARAPQMLLAFAIILMQIPLSALWLKHFRFGPLEWLWRSLTYMQWQSFRNGPQANTHS